jgi:hypothetical protein
MELPHTGHLYITLPPQLKEQIQRIGAAEHQSLNRWVIARLSECSEDEQSRASLAQAAHQNKRLKEVIDRIKDRRAHSAPR